MCSTNIYILFSKKKQMKQEMDGSTYHKKTQANYSAIWVYSVRFRSMARFEMDIKLWSRGPLL